MFPIRANEVSFTSREPIKHKSVLQRQRDSYTPLNMTTLELTEIKKKFHIKYNGGNY